MKHFSLYELVPQKTFVEMGDNAWTLFKTEALMAIDNLAEFFIQYHGDPCPLSINNWHSSGQRQYCGWRPEECVDADRHPIGAGEVCRKIIIGSALFSG